MRTNHRIGKLVLAAVAPAAAFLGTLQFDASAQAQSARGYDNYGAGWIWENAESQLNLLMADLIEKKEEGGFGRPINNFKGANLGSITSQSIANQSVVECDNSGGDGFCNVAQDGRHTNQASNQNTTLGGNRGDSTQTGGTNRIDSSNGGMTTESPVLNAGNQALVQEPDGSQ